MKVLIITGGSVEVSFAAAFLEKYKYDKLYAVDKGIETISRLDIKPDLLLGDFDSVASVVLDEYIRDNDIKVVRHNPIKDATDTELAIDKAIEAGADEIYILGATGTRIDHMLGNIHCLYKALSNGVKCVLWDSHNRIELIDAPIQIVKNDMFGKYVSFIPFGNTVEELTLRGFKYNLDKYTLEYGTSIGVSNEVTKDTASVDFSRGILIYFQTRD